MVEFVKADLFDIANMQKLVREYVEEGVILA